MGYIANMCSGATAGFKFFDCKNVTEIAVRTRGDANGCFVVRTAWDGAPLGVIPLGRNNEWENVPSTDSDSRRDTGAVFYV